uniref:tRNA-synt_2 domain-containing protein n=1 Tax=Panagrellus redivivus TaxID=6233 RepID=A0A7E5A0G9_PANRE
MDLDGMKAAYQCTSPGWLARRREALLTRPDRPLACAQVNDMCEVAASTFEYTTEYSILPERVTAIERIFMNEWLSKSVVPCQLNVCPDLLVATVTWTCRS